MECEYCHKVLSSRSSLKVHQTTAKYCLKMQNKVVEDSARNYTCIYCNKVYVHKHRYSEHVSNCKNRAQFKAKSDKNRIQELEKLVETLKNEIITLKIEHQKEIAEIYKQDHDELVEIAKAPKTTTNNNNSRNIVFTTPLNLDQEHIKQKMDMLSLIHVQEGQKGVAKFVYDNLLITDDGESLYKCRDASRKTCEYLSTNGQVEKDVNTTKLRKAVGPSLKTQALNITRDNYPDDVDQQQHLFTKYKEIEAIEIAPEVFSKTIAELAT